MLFQPSVCRVENHCCSARIQQYTTSGLHGEGTSAIFRMPLPRLKPRRFEKCGCTAPLVRKTIKCIGGKISLSQCMKMEIIAKLAES